MFKDFFAKLGKALKKLFEHRTLVLGLVLLALVVVVFVRLFDVQVLKGSAYYEKYMNTTKKEVSIAAQRGNIYDRNGKLLAGNKVVYNVAINDGNEYTKSNGDFNEMLLRLINILDKYNVEIKKTLPVIVNDEDEFAYSGSETKIRQFIRDVYGTEYIS